MLAVILYKNQHLLNQNPFWFIKRNFWQKKKKKIKQKEEAKNKPINIFLIR